MSSMSVSGRMANSNSFAALQDAEIIDESVVESKPKVEPAASSAGSPKASSSADGKATKPKQRALKDPLIWIDLEMTGLDVDKHTIIEVACIATDGLLTKEIQGPAYAIHANEETLSQMNEWCVEHHGKSGLTQRVRESTVTMEKAEQELLDFVKSVSEYQTAQLAGNSVHVDRQFLLRHMPRFVEYLSYRIVDVSSVKELARRWYPEQAKKAPRKVLAHTALSDIKESIAELQYYRKTIFKDPKSMK